MPLYDPIKMGEVDIPPLLPEQERDALKLARWLKACDFSEPGAAKTLTSLKATEHRDIRRLLVIAPPIALRMWTRTAAAFFKTEKVFLLDTGTKLNIPEDIRVVITTYALAANNLVNAWLSRWTPDGIILDEADALKTIDSQRTKAVYGKLVGGYGEPGLIINAYMVLPLTGTPVRRYNDDMYPHLRALAPKLLNQYGALSHSAFIRQFCRTSLKSYNPRMRPKEVVVGSQNTELLQRIVYQHDFAVRRLVSDLATMPPVTFTPIDVPLKASAELKEATHAIANPEMYEDDTPATATVRRLLGRDKAAAVADFVLEKGIEHGLILYWHKDAGDALEAALRPHGTVRRIDGSTPQSQKQDIEDAYNAGATDFLLGQIASMGVSLNLQKGGNVAVFAEPDWSPAAIEQAFRRLWRFGQEKHVQVYMCYADHPADIAAQRVLKGKSSHMDVLSTSSSSEARKAFK